MKILGVHLEHFKLMFVDKENLMGIKSRREFQREKKTICWRHSLTFLFHEHKEASLGRKK